MVPGVSAKAQNQTKLDALDFLTGEWSVEVDWRLSMQGPWEKSTAQSSFTRTLQNNLIEEEFSGKREGKDFPGRTLFAFNSQTGRYQRVFIDGPHGVLIDFEGAIENGKIIFDRTWAYANGKTAKLSVTSTVISDDSFIVESMRMPETATDWAVNGRMTYTRIK